VRRSFRFPIPVRERRNLSGGYLKTPIGRSVPITRSLPGLALRPAFSVATGLCFNIERRLCHLRGQCLLSFRSNREPKPFTTLLTFIAAEADARAIRLEIFRS